MEKPDRILSYKPSVLLNISRFYAGALKPLIRGRLYLKVKTPIQTRSLKKYFQICKQAVRKFAVNFSLCIKS